jgi:hypothetical protein
MSSFLFILSFMFIGFADDSEVTPQLFAATPTQEQQELKQKILKYYIDESTEVLIGSLLGTRPGKDKLGFSTLVDIKVDEWVRGSKQKEKVISRRLPYRAPYVTGNPMTVPPILIKGYTVIVFVNRYGTIIDGNAIFVVVQDHVFRHKKPDIFLNPIYDRKWKKDNPHDDYLVYTLSEVRQQVQKGIFPFFR